MGIKLGEKLGEKVGAVGLIEGCADGIVGELVGVVDGCFVLVDGAEVGASDITGLLDGYLVGDRDGLAVGEQVVRDSA